ncbi:hypothetical protein WMF30_10990 [Sorangium sp. So ce134]
MTDQEEQRRDGRAGDATDGASARCPERERADVERGACEEQVPEIGWIP